MRLLALNTLTFALVVLTWNGFVSAQDDWPVWRGPSLNGVAPSNQNPPTKWDAETNVKWKVKVPGRGHSSPIVVGDKIFLTTAKDSEQVQSVLGFSRSNGKQLWETPVNTGNFEGRIHRNNTHASPTIVATKDRLFASFNNNRSVQLVCLDHSGKVLWNKNTGQFTPRFPFGFGASPCLYKDTVIVTSDCPGNGYIAAFRQKNGEEVWRTPRARGSSYSSPIIANVGGKEQLVISGTTSVYSYDPSTGKENWNVQGPWQVTCGTAVWDDDMVFVSGGFPTAGTLGIQVKNAKVAWQKPVKSYEQSMLVHNGHVYAVSDNGVAYCWEAKQGTEKWKQRLWKRGGVSTSPVLVGDNIYFTNERGATAIVKANPNQFEVIAENQLGEGCFATPAFLNGEIFTRVFFQADGKNYQWLYCLAEK